MYCLEGRNDIINTIIRYQGNVFDVIELNTPKVTFDVTNF
jgi:hypothetical protein